MDGRAPRGRLPGDALLALALVVDALLAWLQLLPREVSLPLPPAKFVADGGAAHRAPVPAPWRLLAMPSDGPASRGSQLRLLEDGVALGPPHAPHQEVRERGGGRYSHWEGSLWMSSSDGSDPAGSRHRYQAEGPVVPTRLAWLLAAGLNAVAAVAAWPRVAWAVLFLAGVAVRLWRRRTSVAAAACVVAAAWLVLASLEVVPAVGRGAAKGVQIAEWGLLGAAGGTLLALLVALVGAGLGPAGGTAEGARTAAAFPIGLSAAGAFAACWLAGGAGVAAAGAIVAGGALACAARRSSRETFACFTAGAWRRLPVGLLVALLFTQLWHGPSDVCGNVPMGDLVYYGARCNMLAARPWPHVNLGLEGEVFSYFNALPSALVAVVMQMLERLGAERPDGQTVLVAGSAAFAALWLPAAFAACAGAGGRGAAAFASGLLVLGSVMYGSWILESPPVCTLLPLAPVTTALVLRAGGRLGGILGGGAAGIAGSLAGKVTAAPFLAALAGAEALGAVTRASRAARTAALAAGALAAAGAAFMVWRHWDLVRGVGLFGPFSLELLHANASEWSWKWPILAKDLGLVLVMAGAFCCRWSVRVSVASAVAAHLAIPFFFSSAQPCACLVLAAALLLEAPVGRAALRMAALGGALLSLHAWARDPGGAWAFAAWALLVLQAVLPAPGPAWRPAWFAAAFLAATGFLATAAGGLRLDALYWQEGVLTPGVRASWRAVRTLVPPDALLFTDQVAADQSLTGGWNTYAMTGERQVFLANWVQSEVLRARPERVPELLRMNEAVLSGRMAPWEVPLSRRYSEAWALTAPREAPHERWERRAAGDGWMLWRIGPLEPPALTPGAAPPG